jgi:hypothetical protein
MADADGAGIVAAAAALERRGEAALRFALGDFFEGRAGHAAPAWRSRFVNFDGHLLDPFK